MPLARIDIKYFNAKARLPYGLTIGHICSAMNSFLDFLGFVNDQLETKSIAPLEQLLMPANFSSIVGEYVVGAIPQHCKTLAKNQYHNGRPDLIPSGKYPKNALQYGHDGVEVKASRYLKGWQGHNAEKSFLIVFCFESGRPTDNVKGIAPKPFRYLLVCGAQLEEQDWTFTGRSGASRRTITAAVNKTGYTKMMQNWIYKAP